MMSRPLETVGAGVEAPATTPAGRVPRVLLCTDDAAAVEKARATLEASGFAVCVANGREAADHLMEPLDFAVLHRSSRSVDADAPGCARGECLSA